MGVITTKYVKKPLFVEAVRITRKNFNDVAKWCEGHIQTERPDASQNASKKYIKIQTHNPINNRQTKAFVGDWLLKTNRGFKIYTHNSFTESFDEVDRRVESQVQDFEEEDDLDSCASPMARINGTVPQ